MAELKTKPTKASVKEFIDGIADDTKRRDCRKIMQIMKKATKSRPKMWGSSIVGYGSYHYKYASGREGDWFAAGFAPRARDITLYIMGGFKNHGALMKKLGKHKTGKGCLYIKRLEDVDVGVLEKLVDASVKQVTKS